MGRGSGQGEGQGWQWGDDVEGQQPGEGQGGAFGKRGQGQGGQAPESPTDTGLRRSKAKSMLGKGKYVGLYFMKGDPPKGTARVEYAQVEEAASEEAMDALENQRIPASQRDYVRDYFDAIRVGEKDKDK